MLDGAASHGEFQYILDGQQRTTALLTSIYGGRIKGEDAHDPRLFVDLTVAPSEEPEDESWRTRFLFWDVAMAKNAVLEGLADPKMKQARRLSKQSGETEHVCGEGRYAARTWLGERRVIFKAEGKQPKDNPPSAPSRPAASAPGNPPKNSPANLAQTQQSAPW